jgi:hypothetical protein
MEQLELLEFILVSEHDSRKLAEKAASAKRASKDGWKYAVMRKSDYETGQGRQAPKAA